MNYLGIDHHRQYSHLTLMDEKGDILRSGSCSIKWFRHSRIWFGWTLNSLAIWTIVFSPLAASKATLALKAASYVFLILVSIPYFLMKIWQAQKSTLGTCPVFGGKLKEVYLHQYLTVSEARRSLEKYSHFCNMERIHESLGYKTPYEIYIKERVNQQTKQAA